jgi:hypothetical protein
MQVSAYFAIKYECCKGQPEQARLAKEKDLKKLKANTTICIQSRLANPLVNRSHRYWLVSFWQVSRKLPAWDDA